jgi:hypothetical protein
MPSPNCAINSRWNLIGAAAEGVDRAGAQLVLELAQQHRCGRAGAHQGAGHPPPRSACAAPRPPLRAIDLGCGGQGDVHVTASKSAAMRKVDQCASLPGGCSTRPANDAPRADRWRAGPARPRALAHSSTRRKGRRPCPTMNPAQPLVVELGGDELPAAVQLAHQHSRPAPARCRSRWPRCMLPTVGWACARSRAHRCPSIRWRCPCGAEARGGARGQPDEVGGLDTRGPELVAIDDEVAALQVDLQPRRGLQGCQVAAGLGLGIADGEDGLAAGDAGQEAVLLQPACRAPSAPGRPC